MAFDQPVECFWIAPTTRVRRKLRVYRDSELQGNVKCSATNWSHDASSLIGDFEQSALPTHRYERSEFPAYCPCGYKFTDEDFTGSRQVADHPLYVRDNGELYTLRGLPPGAMYDMPWKHEFPQWCGPDGLSICVILPNGAPWEIDGRCSNCTLPDDMKHKCWVRHGAPPKITVDKNGFTCSAGAGSIMARDYHGFLRDGYLVPA